MDLAPMVAEASFELGDFYSSVRSAVTDQGRIWALPVMAEMPGVFYNKRHFDEAGVSYPEEGWHWDDFVKKVRKLTVYDADGDVVRYGAYMVPRLLPIEPLAWSNGGAFLSEEGMKATGYLDDPATSDAIRKYIEVFYPMELTPFQDVGHETWISCFNHQRMSMYYDANWTIKPMKPMHRELFGAVMPPRMGDGPYPNIVQVYGYGISSQASDTKLAWAFLQEIASPYTEAGQEWAKHNLAVSRPVAATSGQEADPLYAPFLAAMDSARLGAFDRSSMRLWKYWNNDLLRDWIVRGGRIHLERRLAEIAREYDNAKEHDK